jgi:hypothetical protein
MRGDSRISIVAAHPFVCQIYSNETVHLIGWAVFFMSIDFPLNFFAIRHSINMDKLIRRFQ